MNHIAIDDPATGIYHSIPMPDDLEDAMRSAHELLTGYFLIPGVCEDDGFIKRFLVIYTVDGTARATSVEARDRVEAFEVINLAAQRGVLTIPCPDEK